MSFTPDNSRSNREIFRARDEELERVGEQHARTRPEDSDAQRQRRRPARLIERVRIALRRHDSR
jgi:hypothetical protein